MPSSRWRSRAPALAPIVLARCRPWPSLSLRSDKRTESRRAIPLPREGLGRSRGWHQTCSRWRRPNHTEVHMERAGRDRTPLDGDGPAPIYRCPVGRWRYSPALRTLLAGMAVLAIFGLAGAGGAYGDRGASEGTTAYVACSDHGDSWPTPTPDDTHGRGFNPDRGRDQRPHDHSQQPDDDSHGRHCGGCRDRDRPPEPPPSHAGGAGHGR
jgi:hypothetical protein